MKVALRPEAESDIVDAAWFYDEQEPGLGDEVADFLYREIATLSQSAGIHRTHKGIYRFVMGGRFPYFVAYYQLTAVEVRVLGVFDHRRDPARIAGFVRKRLDS